MRIPPMTGSREYGNGLALAPATVKIGDISLEISCIQFSKYLPTLNTLHIFSVNIFTIQHAV